MAKLSFLKQLNLFNTVVPKSVCYFILRKSHDQWRPDRLSGNMSLVWTINQCGILKPHASSVIPHPPNPPTPRLVYKTTDEFVE